MLYNGYTVTNSEVNNMKQEDCPIEKFRQLPLPYLMLHITAKSVFSFGIGASLASPRNSPWKRVGCIAMIIGTLLALPSAVKVLREYHEE